MASETEHRHTDESDDDPACAAASGRAPAEVPDRTLVAVFSSPVAAFLLHFAHDLGFRTVLLEPDPSAIDDDVRRHADTVVEAPDEKTVDADSDVVLTDHHRDDLGAVLRDVLEFPARWVGVMGSPRHVAPHIAALESLGVAEDQIARVHRPIGLNIGSKTPAEIAVAALAGLLADRSGRPGGFEF
jgi:xanthine/CO dehydrogenase XdhC/CoxF family maturation factor